MTRIEHFDDPNAPPVNRLIPAASAVIVNEAGEILLQRRADNNLWSIPGGAMEPGESIGQTVVREVKEETGVEVEPEAIVGIYSDPRYVVEYADGEVRQQFSVCFACRIVGGTPRPGEESREVAFVAPSAITELAMNPSIVRRIDDYLAGRRGVIA